MLNVLLWIQVLSQVWSEDLPPPQDVHVDSLLTWTPVPEHRSVTYTVKYRSFGTQEWQDVPACVQTELTSCDVTSVEVEAEHGCVELRVRAEKHGLASRPVEACSKQGDSCSPDVRLTSRPGFLTVHLSRNHSMALEHGDHAKHMVYYGREGEPLQEYGDATSSVSIRQLEEGERYCVKVQFIFYDIPLGPPSCTRCEVIPESSTKHTVIVAPVVVVVVMVFLIPAIAYILIFQRERIKRWMRPPYMMPEFLLQPFPEQRPVSVSSPGEEHYDAISLIFREESSRRA